MTEETTASPTKSVEKCNRWCHNKDTEEEPTWLPLQSERDIYDDDRLGKPGQCVNYFVVQPKSATALWHEVEWGRNLVRIMRNTDYFV